ncbi:proto-oncogene tyrosine-protein kinase receptor Ret-like [Hydra vulgaris]|uniref:proto-oncogene tyrosine-protein kinase receptor Ret-like n=1 Tax=Hydra vulgaris TaxID=6087 RepID=UPI0032EA8A50
MFGYITFPLEATDLSSTQQIGRGLMRQYLEESYHSTNFLRIGITNALFQQAEIQDSDKHLLNSFESINDSSGEHFCKTISIYVKKSVSVLRIPTLLTAQQTCVLENTLCVKTKPKKVNRKRSSISEEVPVDDNHRITPNDLLRFAWQVTSGMDYLSSIKLVHQDHAAINILVGADKIIKISDFGLTHKINADLNYMGGNNRFLPNKRMSVEAIFDRSFTT